MKYVFKDLFGQFGAVFVVTVVCALGFAVVNGTQSQNRSGSSFTTLGDQMANCQNNGFTNFFGNANCDTSRHSTIKVRKVETTTYQRILGN